MPLADAIREEQISDPITGFGNCFVTSSGEDFLDVLQNALAKARLLQILLHIG